MLRRIASVTGVAIAALACLAPACQGGAFHGVVSRGNLSAADYDRMASGNVGTLRLSLRWTNVQPNAETPPEAWTWAGYDAVVAAAADQGVRILPTLDAPTPKGVADPPTSRADRRAFAKFAGEVAARYGRDGAFWEGREPLPFQAFQIYNEQNGPAYWGARPNVRDYGKLLRGAAKAIRGKDRRAEVVLGGMFSTPSGRGGIDSWNYLAKLYRVKRIKASFDTVAVHPYSESLRGIKYQVRRVLAVIRRNHDRKTDLRVTEFGWGSARHGHLNVGRRGQARMLTKAFRLFEGNRRSWNLKGVNWFSFQDNPGGECSFCPTSGLFESSGDPKPSWRAFKRAARN